MYEKRPRARAASWKTRRWRAVAGFLPACAVLTLFACALSSRAQVPVAATAGVNFYPEEQWEPGKLRRWMRNDAELRVENAGSALPVNLRFVAESFRIPRQLQVRVARQVVLDVTVPAEPLYVVIKGMPLAAGETVVTFSAAPGPDQVSLYRRSADTRELSIAFGPFSAIDARSPEAQREETAAFPQADRVVPNMSAAENTAGNLRRQGRLLEARDAYDAALASDRADPTTYIWAGLTLIALDDLRNARVVLTRGQHGDDASPTARSAQQTAARVLDYLDRSPLLAHQDQDPARAFRQRGEIDRAVAIYRRVLQQEPQNLAASYWLGLLSGIAERPKEAAPLLETVARASPDTADGAMAREMLRYVGGR
jgi:tetratricopeptide (TPR) repeat protein